MHESVPKISLTLLFFTVHIPQAITEAPQSEVLAVFARSKLGRGFESY
jgi:hypothetical protein